MIVLPGLDRDIDDESWQALDPSHPQFGLRQLLEALGCPRHEVKDWPGATSSSARTMPSPSQKTMNSPLLKLASKNSNAQPSHQHHSIQDLTNGTTQQRA